MKLSTKQTLLSVIKGIIRELELDAADYKKWISFCWEKSEKGTVDSEYYFKMLNVHKTAQRLVKKDIKRYAAIAKELKG